MPEKRAFFPAVREARSSPDELWLHLSAFLSTRSAGTQSTYVGVVNEWCKFLKVDPGSAAGAERLVSVKDIHAIAYRNWLEGQAGEIPRWLKAKSAAVKERAVLTEVHGGKSKRRDGLQNTLSNATIAKKIAILRRIYRMLVSKGFLSLNPFASDSVVPPPKDAGRKRPTEMLDFKLVKRIVSAPDARTERGLRDRAILALFFGAGLRRGEVRNLRVGDVRHSKSGVSFVYLRSTKARKDAEQALPEWAAKFVTDHVKSKTRRGASPAEWLFTGYTGRGGAKDTGRQISTVAIYELFIAYCKKAGAAGFATPHSARATAITKLLADGVPHRKVQEFSRHASVQMVELYDKRRLGLEDNPGRGLDYDD